MKILKSGRKWVMFVQANVSMQILLSVKWQKDCHLKYL